RLEDDDAPAHGAEADSRGEPPESRPDHQRDVGRALTTATPCHSTSEGTGRKLDTRPASLKIESRYTWTNPGQKGHGERRHPRAPRPTLGRRAAVPAPR